ncbi:UNVERIFIED_CONTAM: hypothetical protein Slati_1103800 [Sesamum latifolium]|uniref:Uncharacterized protein n=1 Tax=Sesamum latifolium TaxID=2727402 RepID=A0AAW2XAU4_9LAMI
MEDAQASKREGQGEKRKENKDEGPSKKSKMDFKDKKPAWQRVNAVCTPLTVPITQARSWRARAYCLSLGRTRMDLNVLIQTSSIDFITTMDTQLKSADT